MPKRVCAAARAAKTRRKGREEANTSGAQEAIADKQPRDQVCAESSSANSRCRFTLVARHLFRGYFSAGDPQGDVDSSILVVPGQHCRLENIDDAGCWVADEEFQLGSASVVRRAGESAGTMMASWRSLRKQRPELFKGILVWQSPTAIVDPILWSWQQAEESRRFESCIKLAPDQQPPH